MQHITAQIRIVKLAQLLSSESSPKVRLKSADILTSLEDQGLSVTDAELRRDIATLRKCGYNIKSVTLPTGEYYYLDTERRRAEEIESSVRAAVRSKTQLCVSLIGVSGELFISPYAVFQKESEYYAACYSSAHRRITLIPFSKLCSVRVTDAPALTPPTSFSSFYYTERGFELSQSACETVTLGFTRDELGAVCEYFGNGVHVRCDANGLLSAVVSTEVGTSLFAWVFSFGGKVRIISPDYVCREYKNNLRTQLAANC